MTRRRESSQICQITAGIFLLDKREEKRGAGQIWMSVTSKEGKKEKCREREGMSEEEKGDTTRQEELCKTKEAPHSAASYLSEGSYPPPALLV